MKLLVLISSVKMSKLIPLVLLASILALSLSLVTFSNAFALQVWESSIAKFEYPDNWNITTTNENGEGISLQPINESNVYLDFTVFQDSDIIINQIAEYMMQFTMNEGLQIYQNITDVLGGYGYIFGSQNGNGVIGLVYVLQIPNTNDVVVTEYLTEQSKFQQYLDRSGFFIYTKLSPLEQGMSQDLDSEPGDEQGCHWEWNPFDPWGTGQTGPILVCSQP